MQARYGAAARVQQTEIVIDLCGRSYGRAGIARLVFLLDRNRRCKAVHMLDVRLLDTLEKLPGIGGERFNISALTFGINRVKGQRAFAGAAYAADYRQLAVGDINIDPFQVVRSCATNCDLIVHPHPEPVLARPLLRQKRFQQDEASAHHNR